MTNPNKLVTQAAICCGDNLFGAFLRERFGLSWAAAVDEGLDPDSDMKRNTATRTLCGILGIKSRTELRTDDEKAALWRVVYSDFELWKIDI